MQVLIYDGECSMCSKFIRFIVRINRNQNLYITDFNSNWTKKNIKLNSNIDSMIFISRGKKYIYSSSILHLLAETNFFFKFFLVFKIFPKILRDKVYKILAKNRNKFNKFDSCPIPTKKGNNMFLS